LRSKSRQEITDWLRYKTFIKDPIHGVIYLNNLEARIVDSPVFLRLHGIKQLGFTYLVYPQAKHSRFEHSLGSMHTAGLIADSLVKNADEELGEIIGREPDSLMLKELFRVAALLHDIGHLPYSHATEAVLTKGIKEGWVSGRVIEDYEYAVARNLSLHEAITCNLIKLLVNKMKKLGKFPAGVVEASLKVLCDDEVYGYWRDFFTEDVISIVRSVISGRITDIDKIDYLVRDAYNTGAKFGLIDIERLVSSIKAKRINNKIKILIPAKLLSNVEDLYYARYMMFKYVYLHHRVIATEACYEKTLKFVFDNWSTVKKSLTPILGRTVTEAGDLFFSKKIFDYAFTKGILLDDSLVEYLLKTAYRFSGPNEKEWFDAVFLRKKTLKPLFKREATFHIVFSRIAEQKGLLYRDPAELLKDLYRMYEDIELLEKRISEELSKSLGCELIVKIIPPISSLKEELPLVDVDGFTVSIDKISPFISAIEKAGEAPTIFAYARRDCRDSIKAIEHLVNVLIKLSS